MRIKGSYPRLRSKIVVNQIYYLFNLEIMNILIKIKIVICFLLVTTAAVSQSTFIKKIKKNENRSARQIVQYTDRTFVLAGGICDFQYSCSLVMELDEEGNVLWDKTIKWLDSASKSMIIEDDIIYLSGNHSTLQKWQWHHMSVNGGDSLATFDIADETNVYDRMFNLGQIKYKNEFCIYGTGRQGDKGTSLLYFVDKLGGLDTTINLLWTELDAVPWRIVEDNNGELLIFIQYTNTDQDNQRIIARINDQKKLTWTYFSEENWFNLAVPKGTVLQDGKIVYNTRINFNQDHNLRAINPDSTIAWEYESPNQAGKYRNFRSLQTLNDGSILGTGHWGDAFSNPNIEQVPWIIKISADGEKIWEHIYYNYETNGEVIEYGLFNDAIELDDGSFIVVGNMDQGPGLPADVLIATLDSEGCLMEDCPLKNDVSDILSNVTSVYKSKLVTIYPNPVESILTIESEDVPNFIEVITSAGSLVKKDSNTQQLDLTALPKGMYLLTIHFDKGIEISSFIKI